MLSLFVTSCPYPLISFSSVNPFWNWWNCKEGVIDLTLSLDSEGIVTPSRSTAKVTKDSLEGSEYSLILIEEGHSMGMCQATLPELPMHV